MNPKYWRVQISSTHKTECPWCARINNHQTGDVCSHVCKVTDQGVVFYYWGFRPISEVAK